MRSLAYSKTVVASMAFLLLVCLPVFGQTKTSKAATLSITATVQPSISIVFQSDPTSCPLSVENESTAYLNIGFVNGQGPSNACATWTNAQANNYILGVRFRVVVAQYNATYNNFVMSAKLLAAPGAGTTYAINNITLNTTAYQTIGSSALNGSTPVTLTENLGITVDRNGIAAGTYNQPIGFQVVAN